MMNSLMPSMKLKATRIVTGRLKNRSFFTLCVIRHSLVNRSAYHETIANFRRALRPFHPFDASEFHMLTMFIQLTKSTLGWRATIWHNDKHKTSQT